MQRSRTVRHLNYSRLAFFVWSLAMLAFIITNAAAKFAFLMRG